MSFRRLSRRTVLRGLGSAIALPLLDGMLPRPVRGASPAEAASRDGTPRRLAFLCVPNGKHMPDWTPPEVGAQFSLGSILEPVAKFKSQMTILSGLTLNGARALGDGGGDHARSCAAFLTGAHPKKTDGADIRNGVSVDQLAAEQMGRWTRLPSLELGIDRSAQSGNCDSGYSCAYSSNMSWRTESSPVAKEVDPAAVFDRLFGDGDARGEGESRALRAEYKKSILDFVLEDANDLRRRLGTTDQVKLDEYLYAIREVERRISGGPKVQGQDPDTRDFDRPDGVPAEFAEHVRVMFDLMALAFQTDSTRIISFMYANEGSNRSYKEIEVSEGHHDLSHHGNDDAKQQKISKINRFHVSLLAHFLERLQDTREGNGTLLDNCLLVYGSGIGDGNRHNHDDLPIALFGRGKGLVTPGRHVKYPNETPLTNLYLSILNSVGVSARSFGDSTGPLKGLSA